MEDMPRGGVLFHQTVKNCKRIFASSNADASDVRMLASLRNQLRLWVDLRETRKVTRSMFVRMVVLPWLSKKKERGKTNKEQKQTEEAKSALVKVTTFKKTQQAGDTLKTYLVTLSICW